MTPPPLQEVLELVSRNLVEATRTIDEVLANSSAANARAGDSGLPRIDVDAARRALYAAMEGAARAGRLAAFHLRSELAHLRPTLESELAMFRALQEQVDRLETHSARIAKMGEDWTREAFGRKGGSPNAAA